MSDDESKSETGVSQTASGVGAEAPLPNVWVVRAGKGGHPKDRVDWER
jgi:hypothetical protein